MCKRSLKLKEVAISTSIQFQILSLFVCPKKPQQVAKVNKKLMESKRKFVSEKGYWGRG